VRDFFLRPSPTHFFVLSGLAVIVAVLGLLSGERLEGVVMLLLAAVLLRNGIRRRRFAGPVR
jgi:hypothetical protein